MKGEPWRYNSCKFAKRREQILIQNWSKISFMRSVFKLSSEAILRRKRLGIWSSRTWKPFSFFRTFSSLIFAGNVLFQDNSKKSNSRRWKWSRSQSAFNSLQISDESGRIRLNDKNSSWRPVPCSTIVFKVCRMSQLGPKFHVKLLTVGCRCRNIVKSSCLNWSRKEIWSCSSNGYVPLIHSRHSGSQTLIIAKFFKLSQCFNTFSYRSPTISQRLKQIDTTFLRRSFT